jgi:hypothetical protein
VALKSVSWTTIYEGMELEASNHHFVLESGARLDVIGQKTFDFSMSGKANLNGTIFFELRNPTKNDPRTVLLTIATPSGTKPILPGLKCFFQ